MTSNDISNQFSAKLRFYMDKNKITGLAIANRIGVSKSSVISWANGTRKFPKDILKIYEIADILNISVLDLLPYSLEEKKKIVKTELQENIEDYQELLPLNIMPDYLKSISLTNGIAGAGSFGVNGDGLEVIHQIYVDIHTIDKAYRQKDLQSIAIAGDSMTPYVNDGDIAIFYKFINGETANGDGKYIISTSQGEQIKNIKFMLNGNIRIISENPSYHTKDGYDEEVDKSSQEYLNIIGKVVGRILKG
jgi:phage repressor protein C with HTH and peptisase S24 domain